LATAVEHAEIVLSGILPNRKDRLEKAMRRLTPEHFEDRKHANLFKFLEKYSDSVNAVLPRKFLDDHLKSKVEEAQHLTYMELYDSFAEKTIEDPEFFWSVDQLRELAAEKETGEAITEAMEILRKGKEVSRGAYLKGHVDARNRLTDSISVIDRELYQVDAPEGFVQDEEQEILNEYEENRERRLSGKLQGVGFGVEALDNITGGMQRGELVIVAASSSNGKSSLAAQSAWHAATQQGKNVIFFATETGRVQIRRKLIARHSKLEMFDLPEGLNTRDLKEATLTEREEKIFKDVVADLSNNSDYGKIHLAQVPRGSTIASLEHKISRISRNVGVDFVVMDYLALLDGAQKNMDDRNKQMNTLREAKLVATSAADGLGIPFLSPWQIKREGRKDADSTGYYDMTDLSDTSEAEKVADLIISIYREKQDIGRYAEANGQILKNRDGERSNQILMDVDYATCTFTSKAGIRFEPAANDHSIGGTSLEDLY